jgi:hypothetical protein
MSLAEKYIAALLDGVRMARSLAHRDPYDRARHFARARMYLDLARSWRHYTNG